jgi:hypothetical protein
MKENAMQRELELAASLLGMPQSKAMEFRIVTDPYRDIRRATQRMLNPKHFKGSSKPPSTKWKKRKTKK